MKPKDSNWQRQALLHPVGDAQLDGIAQIVEAQPGGVHADVGDAGDPFEQFPFVGDRFLEAGLTVRQGVLASGGTVALDQGGLGGIQKENFTVEVIPAGEALDDTGKGVQVAGQVAGVDADRQLFRVVRVAQHLFNQLRQQAGGQVVDAVETHIFKDLERRAFAGAGTAADDDQFHQPAC